MDAMRRFVPILLIAVLLAACAQQPIGGGSGNAEVLIPPTTKVLDADDRSALRNVSADGTLRFAATSGVAGTLEPDDVLASEPTAAAPFGLLRRVVAVREEGDEVIVTTVGAQLIDAVHQGTLSVRLELDPTQLASSTALHSGIVVQGFDHTINTDFGTGGLLQATGTLAIDPILDLDIGIGCDDTIFGVCAEIPDLNVLVNIGVAETARLAIDGNADLVYDEELPIAEHNFSPLTFFIGPVPIVLTPRLEIYLTTSGSLTAELAFAADQDLTLTGGFTYNSDEGFDDISQNDASFDRSRVEFRGEATARAALGGRFQLRLYGVVGPYGSLEAGPRLTASQQGLPGPGTLLWELEGCLTGTVGIDSVDVLDLQYDTVLFDACTRFASDANEPPNVFIQVPSAGSQLFVNETVTLRAITSDPNGQDVTCVWTSTVISDPLPVNGCETDVVFATNGARTLTVTATDPAGTSATDTVAIDVDPEPLILVTIASPEDMAFVAPEFPTLLEASAAGGTEPYSYTWSVAYPTDIDGNGGTLVAGIGTTASFEWTPSDDLPVTACQGFSFARLTVDVVDDDGFPGSRGVTIRIGQLC